VTADRSLSLLWVLALCLLPGAAVGQTVAVSTDAGNPWASAVAQGAPLAGVAWWLAHQLLTAVREALATFRTTHEQGMATVAEAINAVRATVSTLDRRLERIEDDASARSGSWPKGPPATD